MKTKIKILLLVVSSFGFFALSNQAQAGTASYTVNFAATLDGFAYVNESCAGGGICTQGFTGADGNPAGGLYAKVTGKNKKNLGYFTKSLTWQDMGVPAGSIVTQVDGKFDVKLAQETHASSQSVGLKLYDAGDVINVATDGVDIETEFDPTSSSWSTRNTDGAKTIQSAYADSATAVTIRMRSDVNSGNNNGAATEIRMDTIVFTITYNAVPTLSIAQPDGTGDTVTVGSSYDITYSLADAEDVVTSAFYYDTNNSGLDGTAITGACATATEGSGVTCAWNTTGVTPGSYYVYGITNDGVNPQVSAYSTGQITINSAGSLSVDIVDSGGSPIGSPSVTFGNKTFDWTAQTSTGTLGVSSQKIRVNNTTGTATWTLSISATSGPTALWQSGGNNYDFNDSAANGRLQINASGSTITPQGGCATTGLTKGSATYFAQGTQDSITLISADGTAQINCYWDITSISMTQDIPASQTADSYSIGMTLTAA